jgi:hypothetical protein
LVARHCSRPSKSFSTSVCTSLLEYERSTDVESCVRYAQDCVSKYQVTLFFFFFFFLNCQLSSHFSIKSRSKTIRQVFSLLNQDGTMRDPSATLPNKTPDEWRNLYTHMVRLKEMDDVFLASQRQGRISFYSKRIK